MRGHLEPLRQSIGDMGFDREKYSDEELLRITNDWISLNNQNYFTYKGLSLLYNEGQDSPPLLVESDSAYNSYGTIKRDLGMQRYPEAAKRLGYSILVTPEAPLAWNNDPVGFSTKLRSILTNWNGEPMHRDLGKEYNLYREGQPPLPEGNQPRGKER